MYKRLYKNSISRFDIYSPTFIPNKEGDKFITTWETTAIDESVSIGLYSGFGYYYDVYIDWGDGTTEHLLSPTLEKPVPHIYSSIGIYDISISGTVDQWNFWNSSADTTKIKDIKQWGNIGLKNLYLGFYNATNLGVITATDYPKMDNVEDMSWAFYGCASLNMDMSQWNVSNVNDMYLAFYGCSVLNSDLSNWDLFSVTTLSRTFEKCIALDTNVSLWDVSKVTTLELVFHDCLSLNSSCRDWDVSSCTNFKGTFSMDATDNTGIMNPDVSIWDTSKATSLNGMFQDNHVCTPNVTNWNVSNVTTFSQIFERAYAAQPDVSLWDTGKGFGFDELFFNATLANPDCSDWNVSSMTTAINMFTGSALSTANYDALLIAWAAQTVQPDVPLGVGTIQYSAGAAATARAVLTDPPNNWIITDGGQVV